MLSASLTHEAHEDVLDLTRKKCIIEPEKATSVGFMDSRVVGVMVVASREAFDQSRHLRSNLTKVIIPGNPGPILQHGRVRLACPNRAVRPRDRAGSSCKVLWLLNIKFHVRIYFLVVNGGPFWLVSQT